MRILSNFNRLFPISSGYTIAILPLGDRFLPTELFVFERLFQDKILSVSLHGCVKKNKRIPHDSSRGSMGWYTALQSGWTLIRRKWMNQTIEITCRLLAMFILAPNPTSNWNYNPDRLVPSLLLLADTERSWETTTASPRRGWWEGEKKEYFLLPITPRAPLDRALLVNIHRRLRDIWGRVRSGVVDAELLALPGSGDSLIARKELCEAKIGEQKSLSHNSFSTFSGL